MEETEKEEREVYYAIGDGEEECLEDSCAYCDFLYDDICPFLIG